DQVGGEPDHQLPLQERLADEAEVEVLQVAQPAVDHLRGAAGGADGVVAALQQRHRVAARGGVEGDAGAGEAAPDHDHLEPLPGDRLDCRLAGEHYTTTMFACAPLTTESNMHVRCAWLTAGTPWSARAAAARGPPAPGAAGPGGGGRRSAPRRAG